MARRSSRRRAPAATPLSLPPLSVEVRNVAGQVLQLELDPQSTVRTLKQRLAEHWTKSPPICQRLLFGGAEALADSQALGALLPEAAEGEVDSPSLRLLMVVSLEDAQRSLSAASAEVRVEALKALAIVAPQNSRGACAAICAKLEDEASEVRAAALQALTRVSKEGDQRALSTVLQKMKEDHEWSVRRSAMQTLMASMPAACETCIAALGRSLADRDNHVVKEAKSSLASFSKSSDGSAPVAAAAVAEMLAHSRPEVRVTALQTLVSMGACQDYSVLSRVAPLLEDRDKNVKHEAQLALAQLVPDGRERALLSSRARLLYGSASAKLGAMKELCRDAPMGDELTIDAVCATAKDQKKGIQIEALKSLAALAPPGHESAVHCVLECLQDARTEVRLAALKVLPKVAKAQDLHALAAAEALQDDELLGQEATRAARLLLHEQDTREAAASAQKKDMPCFIAKKAPRQSSELVAKPIPQSRMQKSSSLPVLAKADSNKEGRKSGFHRSGRLGGMHCNPLLAAALDMVMLEKPDASWRIP